MKTRSIAALLAACGVLLPLSLAMPAHAADRPELQLPSLLMGEGATWALRVPADDKVYFKGVVNFDGAGLGTGNMMYSGAGGAIGLLAAIAAHAIVERSMRSHQKSKLQLQADAVLKPYQAMLDAMHARELLGEALQHSAYQGVGRLADAAEFPGGDWLIVGEPEFSMTQDQSALIVDTFYTVHVPNSPADQLYYAVNQVVSAPAQVTDPAAYWNADGGARLKSESAALLALSVDMLIKRMTDGPAPASLPFKTIHYPEGGAQRMERSQLVDSACGRVVLRTLRGTLMSVPAANDGCSAAPVPAVAPAPPAVPAQAAPPQAAAGSARLLREPARLRDRPTVSGNLLAELKAGSTVQLVSSTDNGSGSWSYVRVVEGDGWIPADALAAVQ